MKKIILFSLLISSFIILPQMLRSQNCYLQASYEANGLDVNFAAQLYDLTVNQQDSSFQPIQGQYIWVIDNATLSGQNLEFSYNSYGQHVVTVTGSGMGCSATTTLIVTLDENNPIDSTGNFVVLISGDSYSSLDCDADINAYVIGGIAPVSFNWNNGVTSSLLNDVCAGEFCVTAVDANGTTAESCFTVGYGNTDTLPNDSTNYGNIYVSIEYYSNSLDDCGYSAWASVYGGTPPYFYQWNTGQNTSQVAELCVGQEICLMVVDIDGNSATACALILADSVYNTDTVLNGGDPWESTFEWQGDSLFADAQIVHYWITNTEICFVWALIYENSYQETMTVCYPLSDSLNSGWYEVILHVIFNNGQKANISFIDNVYLEPSDLSSNPDNENILDVTAYPNPVGDMLNISVSKQGNSCSISVFDLSGKLIYKSDYSGNELIRIETSNWENGMYFLEVRSDNEKSVLKIVK